MLAVAAFGLLACWALAPLASAATAASAARVTTYPMPRVPPTGGTGPLVVTPGPEVWFTGTYPETYGAGEPHYYPEVVRMNALGQIESAVKQRAEGLAASADGSIWYTGRDWIGRIRPDGTVAEYPLPGPETGPERSEPWGPIVAGPDGNVWLSGLRAPADGNESSGTWRATLYRVTPAGQVSEFFLPSAGGTPTRLAAGPDGNVWFTASSAEAVGRITPGGEIKEFPLPHYTRPSFITGGPDGNVWFSIETEGGSGVARITPSGELSAFPLGAKGSNIYAGAIVGGPDGRVWVSAGGAILRVAPDGRISRVTLPNTTGANQLAVGPEGDVWYTAVAEPPCLAGDSVCGNGGSYESGIIGRIEPAPLGVTIAMVKPAAHGRRAKVVLSCMDGSASGACHGRLRLQLGKSLAGKRTYKLGTDLSRGFSVKLSQQAQTALRRVGHLRLTCTATVTGGTKATRVLRLQLPNRG